MNGLFSQYLRFREETEDAPVGVTAHIKLQKKQGSNEFTPFVVDKSNHANLVPIVKAFLKSDKVGLGYTTIDRNKGEIEPQLKKKSLFLTGGAVRDHLVGKTPRNYDLVTDATVSEIRMILEHAGFKEVKGQIEGEKYNNLPNNVKSHKMFYVSKTDKKGKEMEVVAVIHGQPFTISTMNKSPKSRNFIPNDVIAASSVEEDASNRDLTINSMYIPLTNDDGANSDLIDPFGGANHLKSGEIKVVGDNFKDRMKEDPLTAFRMVNHLNRYGKGDSLPEKYSKHLQDEDAFEKAKPDGMKDEFVKGLENPDVSAKRFLKTYKSSGLLNLLFPHIDFDDSDIPNDLRNDRWMVAAWVLRHNNPTDVKDMLMSGGWNRQEVNDIIYLIKMFQWGMSKFDHNQFYDMNQCHTGLTKAKIKDFMRMANLHGNEVDQFLNFNGDDLSSHVSDEFGRQSVNPIYIRVIGRMPVGSEIDSIKKNLMTNRWQDMVRRLT